MLHIRKEIQQVIDGKVAASDSVLHHAPHTIEDIAGDWQRSYSREQALFPVSSLRKRAYYPPVSRIDAAFGDRNLVCTCGPIEEYAMSLDADTVTV
jgi:glycine dehydrogenase